MRPAARRWAPVPALLVALLVVAPPAARTHGGPPLRIGVTATPDQDALGRLLLAHLRDGVGYAVSWELFAGEKELAAAFAAGKIDVAPGCCAADAPAAPAVFPLTFTQGAPSCARLCVAANPRALAELRFTILGDEIRKVVGVLAPADIDAVRSARAGGGDRAAAAAARAVVAGKRLK